MDAFEKARNSWNKKAGLGYGIRMTEEAMKNVRGINCTGFAWNYGNRDTVHSKG